MDHYVTLFKKFFKDSKGRIAIWQTPNIPLIGWALFSILVRVLPAGNLQRVSTYASFGFIFIWALLEIIRGSSYFRRVLGAIVLIVSIHSRFS